MHMASEFVFAGPREKVWEMLHDPAILAKALPGTKRLELVGEDDYEGEMQISVGPVTAASFAVSVKLTNKVVPESFTMVVDGRGNAGFTAGEAHVKLTEQGPEETLMSYSADLDIGGRVAAVGQRLIDSVGKSMAKQGLESINRELTGPMEGTAAGSAGGLSTLLGKPAGAVVLVLIILVIVFLVL
ncbi:MAG: carbon monoxide dehydrogenase subunit G [Gemmatimonadota bacterium]